MWQCGDHTAKPESALYKKKTIPYYQNMLCSVARGIDTPTRHCARALLSGGAAARPRLAHCSPSSPAAGMGISFDLARGIPRAWQYTFKSGLGTLKTARCRVGISTSCQEMGHRSESWSMLFIVLPRLRPTWVRYVLEPNHDMLVLALANGLPRLTELGSTTCGTGKASLRPTRIAGDGGGGARGWA